jgi:hypothetical protein
MKTPDCGGPSGHVRGVVCAEATMTIPPYGEARIRRRIPPGLRVVPGSTPVVSFGDASTAHVATLGINPSFAEFRENGVELTGHQRRLATHQSLGAADLFAAPSEVIRQVLGDCNAYFKKRAYWSWFSHLERILSSCGASYLNGTACHLDLVQWATEVPWRELDARIRAQLLEDDLPFLMQQLQANPFKLLLLNGRTAVQELGKFIPLREAGKIDASESAHLFDGRLGQLRIVGWSCNLQSRGIAADVLFELPSRVAAMALG